MTTQPAGDDTTHTNTHEHPQGKMVQLMQPACRFGAETKRLTIKLLIIVFERTVSEKPVFVIFKKDFCGHIAATSLDLGTRLPQVAARNLF
jgi:hypothetical protein